MSTDPENEELGKRSVELGTQFHDPQLDVWRRHADGPEVDRKADREVRDAIQREKRGEYDADGNFRLSTWRST